MWPVNVTDLGNGKSNGKPLIKKFAFFLFLHFLIRNLYVTQEFHFFHRWIFHSHDAHNSITQINHLLKDDGSNKGATASAKKSMISIKGRGSDTFKRGNSPTSKKKHYIQPKVALLIWLHRKKKELCRSLSDVTSKSK